MTDIIQGSEEWVAARVGKVTASRISDLLAGGKGITRADYMDQIIAERLTGETQESFYENDHMRRGTWLEPVGRASYELHTGALVDEVGFVDHPAIPWAGCSPDGLVGSVGGIELKCPMGKTHVGYLRGGTIPKKYIAQMQWCMACTGAAWWDFVSFHPNLDLLIQRLMRDEEWIEKTEGAVRKFLEEVDDWLNGVQR